MLVTFKTKSKFNRRAVQQRSDSASVDALYKAGAYLRTAARRKIRKSKNPSRPGAPPHTREGQIRNAILFAVDAGKKIAWVGPSARLISDIARYHEFGGLEKIKAERKSYVHDGVGPIDIREGDVNPGYWKSRRTGRRVKVKSTKKHVRRGVAFARLRTTKQVERAKFIDRMLWPSTEMFKVRKYPPRPFMGPAMEASLRQLGKIFSASLAPDISL
jgi:hypothetical protein